MRHMKTQAAVIVSISGDFDVLFLLRKEDFPHEAFKCSGASASDAHSSGEVVEGL